MMMNFRKSVLLPAMTVLAVLGCTKHEPICCDGGYEYRNKDRFAAEKSSADMATRLAALDRERQRLADELAATQKQNGTLKSRVTDLERQLTDRDRDLASLRSGAGDSSKLVSQLSSTQGDLEQSRSRIADLEKHVSGLQTASGEKDRLATELASTQAQLAALQAGTSDKDKLATDLASAKQRTADLERQLAAAQSRAAGLEAGAGDKDQLRTDLAAANQRIAEREAQLTAAQGSAADKDKTASDLTAARQRVAELEAQLATAQASGADKDKVASDLSTAKQRVADLEKQLADRDRELAGLRGDLSAEMAKLKEAQRGLIRALRLEIEKKNITVDLNNERLLINLASGYLFSSGEDQLKPAGADALKHVGAILKDFPEYKVTVDGHTDNRPIRDSLKKKFPSNKELSEARAANAAKALSDGGFSEASTAGYADTRPVAPNTSEVGRAQNRRVEVRVTK